MAQADKVRWDEKYQHNLIPNSPISLVRDYANLALGNHALDIACGMGRHAKYLATQGFEVDALDISTVAITALQDLPHIHPKEVDFDSYMLPAQRYDLIVCSYFLERRLFPQMIDALRPGGLILYETFLDHKDNQRAPSNKTFMFQEGELEAAFGRACEFLYLASFWDDDYQGFKMRKISMVARKSVQTKAQ